MGRGRSGDVAATKGHRTLTWPGLSRRGSRCVTDAPRRMAQQGGDDLTGCNNAASITASTSTSTREPARPDHFLQKQSKSNALVINVFSLGV